MAMTASHGSFSSTEPSGGDPTLIVGSPSSSEGMVFERGQSIGRYLILERIGAGGMAVVYGAYDPELDRKVALKFLKHSDDEGTLAGSVAEGKSRALREAQALAKLSHPNVLAIYDVGTIDDQVFLATELVDGKTVREWLADDSRSWRDVVSVFIAAGRGLAAAHARGIVHRDFKPDNVMVGNDGAVRVMDFGLARRSADGPVVDFDGDTGGTLEAREPDERLLNTALTKTGVVAGTPAYMAPEQHDGMTVDARADQFSFCVALYEGIYGRRPFVRALTGSILDAKRSHRLAPLPTALLRRGPRWLRKILIRGLSPEPGDRWPSMDALLFAVSRSPWVRTRKWVMAAAVVTAATGGSAYAQWQGSITDRMCRGGTERIASIWNATRQIEISAAFDESRVTGSSTAWKKIRGDLDDFASSWAAMHREACEATQVLREQSADILDLRMSCLQQKFWELESLLDVFVKADGEVVRNSVVAVARLGSLEQCADLTALRAEVPPPASPDLERKVEALQKRIAEILALYNTGNVTQAVTLAESLAEESKSVDYPPVRADILSRLGIFQQTAGRHQEAEKTLTQAALLATANRMFLVAARVEAYLVHVIGYALGRYDEALQWADQAEAILAAAGGDDDRASHIMMNRANVLFRMGEIERSYALQVEALRLRETHFGPDHPEIIMTLSNAGALARNTDRVDEAVSLFRRAIEIGEKQLGPDHPQLAFPLLNLSNALMESGDFGGAEAFQGRALEIWQQSTGPRNVHIAEVNLRRSILREYQGKYEEASDLVGLALDIRKEIFGTEHPQYADALRRLGEVREAQERHLEALSAYEEALAIFERTDPGSRGVLHSQIGRGRTLVSLGREAAAIDILESAVAKASAQQTMPEIAAEIHFALARALWAINRTELALDHANRAAQELSERNGFRSKSRYLEVTRWIAART